MKDKTYLRGLLEYNGWANAQLYGKVGELPPEEVTRKRKTLLESIHLSLNHLLAVDRMWLAHMQGNDHGITELRARLYEDLTVRQPMADNSLFLPTKYFKQGNSYNSI